jgi:hypothetical protein
MLIHSPGLPGFIPPDAMSLPQDRIHLTLASSAPLTPPYCAASRHSHDWIEEASEENSSDLRQLSPAEGMYVSADAQISRALFAAVGAQVLGSEDAAWGVLLVGPAEKAKEWELLTETIVKILEAKLCGLAEKKLLWHTLEVSDVRRTRPVQVLMYADLFRSCGNTG